MNEFDLKKEIVIADENVSKVSVSDPETFEVAGRMVIELNRLVKRINEYWDEPIRKAHEAHKALTAKRAEMLHPVDDRKKELRTKISVYLTEQDRIRHEEQRKADEERRKREQAERERLERAAARAEEKGKDEKAADLRIRAAEVYIPPVNVVPEIEKTTRTDAGTISQRKDISIKVLNPLLIIKAVAAGTLPINIININETRLKQAIELAGITQLDGCIIEQVVNAQVRAS